jgi:hypothetical protein
MVADRDTIELDPCPDGRLILRFPVCLDTHPETGETLGGAIPLAFVKRGKDD